MLVARRGDDRHALTDYRGLASARPVLAGLLTLFLLAQAGVPLTGGFVAKLSVFSAAIDVGQYWLALVGMLAAVIGAFVYLRIVLAMYAPPDDETVFDGPRIVVDAGTGLALDDRGRRDRVPRRRARASSSTSPTPPPNSSPTDASADRPAVRGARRVARAPVGAGMTLGHARRRTRARISMSWSWTTMSVAAVGRPRERQRRARRRRRSWSDDDLAGLRCRR